ncbi:uncharacterized protein LOC141607220 [Silene latifolia]|uniref:uncharacterized protein LOC141607220 n=1 Tax=Silene latifolia TaxID=37657 RepID=UPI003D773E11
MDDCRLMDIGFIGELYTRWNRRSEPDDIFECLDRGIAAPEWVGLFPTIVVQHLGREKSYHIALKLSRQYKSSLKNRLFRFEDMWTTWEKCEGVVKEAWDTGCVNGNELEVVANIGTCAGALMKWSKKEFGDIIRHMGEFRKRLCFPDSCL